MLPLLDEEARREHKTRNIRHSVLLMGGMAMVLGLAAWLLWGATGTLLVFATVGLIVLLAPRIPPEVIMRLYRAQPIQPGQAGQLRDIVSMLSERAGLPAAPRLYVIPSLMLNAFATGSRERPAIAVTEGLLRKLTMRQIAGVLAHEISHIRNNDLWVMGLADVMTRFVQLLSYVALALAAFNIFGLVTGEDQISWWAILLLYLAPAIASLLQLGLSRTREYDADLEGAMLTGDPMGLASALTLLEQHTGRFWEDLMFPVPGRRVPQPSLLRSHPPAEKRVARLRELDMKGAAPSIAYAEEPRVTLIGVGPIEMRPRFRWPGVYY